MSIMNGAKAGREGISEFVYFNQVKRFNYIFIRVKQEIKYIENSIKCAKNNTSLEAEPEPLRGIVGSWCRWEFRARELCGSVRTTEI